MTAPRTLFDKIWDDHVVDQQPDGTCLLYIDRHLVHEVTSPQAFEGLRMSGRTVRAPRKTLAVVDHNVPTSDRRNGIDDPESALQIETLAQNARDFGLEYFDELDVRQGICHIIGPEQGFTLPGITLVCGDSHTATHGAFGCLAFGIGASECGTVMATQTLWQTRAKTLRVTFEGSLPQGITPKDMILAMLGRLGASGAVGYAIEYAGEAVRALSMAGRMTLCNMSIEAGSRTGLVAPDETTFAFLAGRPRSPRGAAWDMAVEAWRSLASDPDARFNREVIIDIGGLAPQVTFGSSPDQVLPIDGRAPDPAATSDEAARAKLIDALRRLAEAQPETAAA